MCVCPSIHPPFPLAPQPLSGISVCKYYLIPPSLPYAFSLSLSPSTQLYPLPLSMALIHSLLPSTCLCAPPPHALCPPSIHSCDFFFFFFACTFPRPYCPLPPSLPPSQAVPSNLHLSSISLLYLWLSFILEILVFRCKSTHHFSRLMQTSLAFIRDGVIG